MNIIEFKWITLKITFLEYTGKFKIDRFPY